MAHIPDGVLSTPVLVTGAAVSVVALSFALRRLDYDKIPQTAMCAALFFVASLITVPLGPSSVHLVLNGLLGLVLGSAAVPALLVALVLQSVFFGYGGLIVLGVNLMNHALPALLCGLLLRRCLTGSSHPQRAFWIGVGAGALGIAGTATLLGLSLSFSGPQFDLAAKTVLVTYLPLMVVEAVITGFILAFIQRVAPELLRLRGGQTH